MKKTLEVLNELKEKGLIKDYAIGGAIAALRWTEPFFTRDLDVFVIPIKEYSEKEVIEFKKIYDFLQEKGYNEWIEQWLIIEGIPVEFIPAEGISKEAVENAVEIEFEGIKTKVITPEYLIIMFLKAFREKDKLKINLLLQQSEIDMNKLKELLKKYNLTDKFNSIK
ncbi:MAG: nucleotidyltransferase [Candidatus Omnitrophica bacterium]|nr:nucleotidyltransferase [Candidatus Omnitrophota bacterium]MCM8802621.1 nucleotidyltransferase [Candidatus Omnitrophota bacterium]